MKKAYKYALISLVAVAAVLFAASFFEKDPASVMHSQARKVERTLHHRERILDRYCSGILEGTSRLADKADLPEDMVIYLYKDDTLKGWINQFPIANDQIVVDRSFYRLHHLSGPDQAFLAPLAFLDSDQAYVNLGSAWYYIKSASRGSERLLCGICIKREYPQDNMSYANGVNPRLRLDDKFTTVPLNSVSGAIVKSLSGRPLFSIAENTRSHYSYGYYPLHWVVILLLIVAAILLHFALRNKYSLAIYLAAVTLLAVWAMHLAGICDPAGELFSPLTYAGSNLLDSLASLLTVNVYLVLVTVGLVVMRAKMLKWYRRLGKGMRITCSAVCIAATLLLAIYINYSFRSLIFNSNLSLNLGRIYSINLYSVLALVSYGLLFAALLHLLQMSITSIFGRRVVNLYSWQLLLVYLLIISLYSTLTIYSTSLRKEYSSNKVTTDKLSIDRDLSLEMQLRMIESGIKNDQIIAMLCFWPDGGNDIIRNRLLERYLFRSFSSRYNMLVTTCNSATQLIINRNTPAVNCMGFYSDELRKNGVPLTGGSSFFYMNNLNGQTRYLGVFTYVDYNTMQATNLYIEIASRFMSDKGTNMSGILTKQSSDIDLPPFYSYAKYYSGKLVSYSGRESFPTEINPDDYSDGYYMQHTSRSVRFINKVSEDDLVILSRPVPGFMRHLVLFSYLLLLFGLIIVPATSGLRKSSLLSMPRNSYKRRITLLMLLSTLLALACVGIGTIWFTVKRNKTINERNMVANMEIVQSTLSDYCQYALLYADINTPQLQEAMKSLSNSTGNDINIYDTNGLLVNTTQPEIYNQSVLGLRMDHSAYRAIVENSYMNYIGEESIAGNSFQSIYAPLYNIDGDLVAIANIPHVTGQSQFQQEGAIILASIINLYLVILIASILISLMMADSISKPLTRIRSFMERLPRSNKKEHLAYREGNDELGMLVAAYNRMVDELDESTRRLARTERETAWKEMARQIAHEIKNPLTPMQLSIQHVQRLRKNNVPGWEEEFDKVSRSLLEQIDILSSTASDFSTLSKLLADEQSGQQDLVALLNQEMVLFKGHENISVTFETDLENAFVEIRKQQIIRAFVNLITNAEQALEKTGGNVLVTLCRRGSVYQVTVEDDGPGVRDELISRLFSPNFTTKVGGSGLGLAICKDIFEQNDGSISYTKSERLGGASFVVTLPAAGQVSKA